jgi:hypothetical protein
MITAAAASRVTVGSTIRADSRNEKSARSRTIAATTTASASRGEAPSNSRASPAWRRTIDTSARNVIRPNTIDDARRPQ